MPLSPIQQVHHEISRFWTPKPKRNIWQWADENRFLAKGVSAKSKDAARRYNSAEAPHQREPQESFTDPAVQVTVLIMASQIGGKTEIFNNVLGYFMDHRPTNAVVMYPTIDSAEKYSKKKFAPMVQATPCLERILAPSKSRTSANTILVKDFLGGSIFMVGANSPASLRQASGEILLADEVDAYEADAGGEGDPVELLWKRGESFPNAVKGVSSTPTVKGQSRIWNWFEASDQRYWFVPCPHCARFVRLLWSSVKWPEGKPEDAAIECPECQEAISDSQRLAAYFKGHWEAMAPFKGIRGYHLNWLYCPWPAQKGYRNRLHQFAEEWTRASKKGQHYLKVIINTGLCECWEPKTLDAPKGSELLDRCHAYEDEIPEGVCYLTAAADIQKNRIEYEIVGWGVGEETWGIETGQIYGKVDSPQLWSEFDRKLSASFQHPSGAVLKIGCALIDSGGVDDEKAFAHPVYRFCRPREGRFVFACKGASVETSSVIVSGRRLKTGVMLQLVGTDLCKSVIYERLAIAQAGPGFMHFPIGRGYDEEYFAQLTSERILLDRKGGAVKRRWIKQRERNEALDIRVYNIAAFEIRNVNLAACAENLKKKAVQSQPPAPAKTIAASDYSVNTKTQATQAQPRPRKTRWKAPFASWR